MTRITTTGKQNGVILALKFVEVGVSAISQMAIPGPDRHDRTGQAETLQRRPIAYVTKQHVLIAFSLATDDTGFPSDRFGIT